MMSKVLCNANARDIKGAYDISKIFGKKREKEKEKKRENKKREKTVDETNNRESSIIPSGRQRIKRTIARQQSLAGLTSCPSQSKKHQCNPNTKSLTWTMVCLLFSAASYKRFILNRAQA